MKSTDIKGEISKTLSDICSVALEMKKLETEIKTGEEAKARYKDLNEDLLNLTDVYQDLLKEGGIFAG